MLLVSTMHQIKRLLTMRISYSSRANRQVIFYRLSISNKYGVIARVLKHIYQKDFLPILKNILDELKYIAGLGEAVTTGLSNINEDKIMTTMAEHWKQEGIQKGRQEGIQKGRQEGVQEGYQKGIVLAEQQKLDALRAVAINLFKRGMDVEQIVAVTGLASEEIKSLKNKSIH